MVAFINESSFQQSGAVEFQDAVVTKNFSIP